MAQGNWRRSRNWASVLTDVSIPNLPGQTKRPLYWPLPPDKVYHVGEPVVAVVARDKYLLEDAMCSCARLSPFY